MVAIWSIDWVDGVESEDKGRYFNIQVRGDNEFDQCGNGTESGK